VAGLVWYSQVFDPDPSGPPDYRAGVFGCALVYLGYSTLQGPASVMIRPHPALWKFVHGCAMLYLLALVFILIQGKDEARKLLTVCIFSPREHSIACLRPLAIILTRGKPMSSIPLF
jgi:hypothetical protein